MSKTTDLRRLASGLKSVHIGMTAPLMVEDAADEIDRLRAENARLREALRPFQHASSQTPETVDNDTPLFDCPYLELTVGDLRCAVLWVKDDAL